MAVSVLAGLIGLFVLLISIPFDFKFRFDSSQSPPFGFRFSWFFGLVNIDVSDTRRKPPRKQTKPRKIKNRKIKRKKGPSRIRILRLITKPLIWRALFFIRDVFRSFHFRQIDACIKMGLGEPADTGVMFGLIHAALPVFAVSCQKQIRLIPDFGDEALLKGSSRGIIRLWPVEILSRTVRFVFSKPVLQLAWRAIKQWIGRK
jgi:hypothetical protein